MSYDHRLLCEEISVCLHRNPKSSLKQVSRELQVSPRTVENAIAATMGKKFRDLQKELLLVRIKNLLAKAPNTTIRKVSLEAGYHSPRSFARAVRRICAVTPQQLRTRIAEEVLASRAATRFGDPRRAANTTAIQE